MIEWPRATRLWNVKKQPVERENEGVLSLSVAYELPTAGHTDRDCLLARVDLGLRS